MHGMRGDDMAEVAKGKGNGLKSKALRIAGLIGYQKGAVVSRELIRKGTGTVTLFSFDRGQGLSEHTAPFDALVQVFEGEAAITVSGKQHRVRKGELIILPAGKPHSLMASKRFKMMLIMIRSKK